MAADENLENINEEEFYKNFLLQNPQYLKQNLPQEDSIEFIPDAGFVLKSKIATEKGDTKVFVNICTSEHVPNPREVSEKELAEILDSEDPLRYRVPLSLGEPHAELDKGGQGCTVYDIVINPAFLKKVQENSFFKNFFLTVVFQGLEEKYGLELDRNWTILKNKKCMGKIQTHSVRRKSKPVIVDMKNTDTEKPSKPNIIEVMKPARPKYDILMEPEDNPEYIVLEVLLPAVKSSGCIELDVGGDRLVLNVNPGKYHLDINLPHAVNNDACGAQFNRKNKVLTVTMDVDNNN